MNDKPILVEISIGELFDKISILEIKNSKISDPGKLKNVRTELETLEQVADDIEQSQQVVDLRKDLKSVNEELWEIEDEIRRCESKSDFGEEFIRLARAVYVTNDRRADLKRQINELAGSRLVEEKDYEKYQPRSASNS